MNAAVVIYQRDLDLTLSLHHSWLYLPLISERFDFKNNKARSLQANAKVTDFDLDAAKDSFWQANMFKSFPEVTENIEKEIKAWKIEFESMSQQQSTEDVSQTDLDERICSNFREQP